MMTLGITGRSGCGKSTVTAVFAARGIPLADADQLSREILLPGSPLLPQLADVTPDAVAVVELSSFQLISMRRSPKVAVVTNVTPNHLDHHKDMQEYIDAKRNILLYQNPPCRAVLGYENEISRSMQKDCKGGQVWFTRLHDTDNGAFLRKEDNMLCMAW